MSISRIFPNGEIPDYEWQGHNTGQGNDERNISRMLRPCVSADVNHHARDPKN